jgi:hypothetical protein
VQALLLYDHSSTSDDTKTILHTTILQQYGSDTTTILQQ